MPAPLSPGGTPPFAQRVVAWQVAHGRRELPWQGTRDAYRIWLSEIMLQQTQVGTVLAYYDRFLQRFPAVRDLAQGSLDEVLALWSGLGYYSRARNLHRCAQTVMQLHGGVFPTSAAVLMELPGIGRSTAAAIAAFSCGQRVAILDGNVKRVLSRHLGFRQDLTKAAATRQLWDLAQALMPERDIEAYTQGLMDLGAGLCTQRQPQCSLCPVQADCVARIEGQVQRYPLKTRRSVRGARRNAVLILLRRRPASAKGLMGGRAEGPSEALMEVLMHKRPANGVWGGLWSFPEFDDVAGLQAALEGLPGRTAPQPAIVHALTHFDWHLEPVFHELSGFHNVPVKGCWHDVRYALQLGLPAPVRSLLERVADMQAGQALMASAKPC